MEDWNEASEIRHLLKNVLPGHWKRRVEDEENKRAKKRVAVRIMASEDNHAGMMEFFRRDLGEPSRMLGLKNAVYVEVFGDTMGQRLMRLNNLEWRRGEPLRMQVILARMSLDKIVKYITVELSSTPRTRPTCRIHKDKDIEVIEEIATSKRSRGTRSAPRRKGVEAAKISGPRPPQRIMKKEDGQDRSRWNHLDPRTKNRREPRRIGNPPLSFREYRSQHTGCWVCYRKGNNHAHDHRHCKVYEEDKKTNFAADPDKSPRSNELPIGRQRAETVEKAKERAKRKGGGKGYGGGPGPDRRVRSIEEVAEDMLWTLEKLKAQQHGEQSLSGSQQEGAAAGHV